MIFRSKIQLLGRMVGVSLCTASSLVSAAAKISTATHASTLTKATENSANPATLSATQALHDVETRYSKASAVQMAITKTTENKLLKKKKSATGTLVLKGAGHFRMEFGEPDKSAVILDGKKLWVVQFPQDPDFDNTTRVTVSSNLKKMQTPVLATFLMGKGSLLDDFKITKEALKDHIYEIELSPKKPNADMKSIIVKFNNEKNEITQLTMKDNVDNLTDFAFDKIKFNGDVSDKLFEYKAPQGAEINEM